MVFSKKRNHPADRGESGEYDRHKPGLTGFLDGLIKPHAALAKLIGIIHEEDRILDLDTDKGNDPYDRYKREGIAGGQQHQHCTDDAKRHDGQYDKRAAKSFELQDQDTQYAKDRDKNDSSQTTKALLFTFNLAGSHISRSFGKAHFVQLL